MGSSHALCVNGQCPFTGERLEGKPAQVAFHHDEKTPYSHRPPSPPFYFPEPRISVGASPPSFSPWVPGS